MSKTAMVVVLIALISLGLYLSHLVNTGEDSPFSNFFHSTSQPFSTWHKFIPQSNRFTVMLPDMPQYIRDLVNIPNTDKKRQYEMYIAEEVNGTLFFINIITYPNEVDTSSSIPILQDLVTEMMQSHPKNQLLKLENTLFQTHQMVEFEMDNDEFKVQGKAFMIGKVMYVLNYIARKEDFNLEDYKYFTDSFHLLKIEE